MKNLFLTVSLIASTSFNILGLMIYSDLIKDFLSPYVLFSLGFAILFITIILYLKSD